jgi:DNA (cytosine-5)-methyltransferase 1
MYWNKPAPTITTRFISYSNGRYGHPEQDRAISLREGATLQSFPIDYTFLSESQGAIAKMIGNAVPPLLATAIGTSMIGKTR